MNGTQALVEAEGIYKIVQRYTRSWAGGGKERAEVQQLLWGNVQRHNSSCWGGGKKEKNVQRFTSCCGGDNIPQRHSSSWGEGGGEG